VVVDVDGSGYRLTSAAGGVLFDFAGRGQLVRTAWTARGSTNAFLVLPRNGRVDNGSELFGNLTPQPRSARPNGFAALAVWDQPSHGGNGDGVIDKADAVWPRLRLWQDTDHDGTVQPRELRPLWAFGITGISVRYRAVGGADRYGNRYGYATAVYGTGRAAPVAYDFFFTTAPAGPASPNGWLIAAGAAGSAALAGAALAARRRRRARSRAAPGPVAADQAAPDRNIPVSIGR
jgi:LPXTG-motif cell wall-anchored protein